MEPVSRVAVSVDVVCWTLSPPGELHALVVHRTEEPFAGCWALPGGVVRDGEELDAAARRVLRERTGIDLDGDYLEQLYTFGAPQRDPRGRTISVAYYALLREPPVTVAPGRGVDAAEWRSPDDLPPLAFDHGRIVTYARDRLSQKIAYAPLAFRVLPVEFTMGDLRTVYEAIEGKPMHPSNFERQMLSRWGLSRVHGALDRRTRRPARLYRYTGPTGIPGPPESWAEAAPPSAHEA